MCDSALESSVRTFSITIDINAFGEVSSAQTPPGSILMRARLLRVATRYVCANPGGLPVTVAARRHGSTRGQVGAAGMSGWRPYASQSSQLCSCTMSWPWGHSRKTPRASVDHGPWSCPYGCLAGPGVAPGEWPRRAGMASQPTYWYEGIRLKTHTHQVG